jgi:uncharacterized membrane protein
MPSLLHMDSVLTPTRSLPKAGLYVLLGAVAFVNLALGGMFLAIGAKPIPIFLGLDFLAIAAAFHISNRQARQSERVRVTADEVHVTHEIGTRRRTVWRSPTAFTRVSVDAPGEHETRVSLHLSGRSHVLAVRLSPQERTDFALALQAAIKSARAERYPA